MRKAMLSLLAAVFFAGMAGTTQAADRAGIGLNWGIGPTIQLGDFDMKFDQSFGISWVVSENVSVEVFGQSGEFSGEYTYTDDVTVSGQTFDRGTQEHGNHTLTGLRFIHALPFLKILSVGFDLGVMTFNESLTGRTYVNSDGTTSTAADFGGTVQPLNKQASTEGVLAKLTLLTADTGAVKTELGVMGVLRFVQFQNTYVWGTQETTTSNTTKPIKDSIDPVSSYNHIGVQAALTVGF